MEFMKFVEYNDHEGEEWTFWLQATGNYEQLAELGAALGTYREAEDREDYTLDLDTVLDEHDVDVLVEHGGSGYMSNHNKVVGTLIVPDDLLQDGKYGKNLDDLYGGGIEKLFTS